MALPAWLPTPGQRGDEPMLLPVPVGLRVR